MKDIKIIFFDIDGTLIAMDQDTISEKTLEALKRLQEKGVKLCLATGRGPMLVPHFEGVEFDAFLTCNSNERPYGCKWKRSGLDRLLSIWECRS